MRYRADHFNTHYEGRDSVSEVYDRHLGARKDVRFLERVIFANFIDVHITETNNLKIIQYRKQRKNVSRYERIF